MSIDTGINGHLNFNFSTGAWSYNAPSQLVTNTTETFSYTLIDGDKDTAGANLVISVTAVNDAPTNTVPTARVVNEDTAIVFSSGNNNAISIADADHNGGNETVTLSVLHGNLTLSGLSGLTVTGNGTGNVTVTGTVAAINSALNGLSYLPSDNYNGADTLTIVTNDNGNNGVGGAKSDTDTIAITINPVNDAPVITPETREVSYIENGNDLKLLSNAVITDPDNPTSLNGGFISVTLGNTVAGDQLQIADNSNVRLQGNNVQISNGFGGWTTIGTISAGGFGGTSVTITLNSNADVADVQTVVRSLAFYSSSDNPTGVDRTATITFNDGGHDGSGGALSDSSTVTVHVTPVNDAPVIAGGSERSVSVAENSTAVTTVTSTDPDGGTPTYSIVQTAGTDFAKFTINPVTGALSFVNAPDYENPTDVGGTNGNNTYEVDVRVSDGNGGTAVQTINVTVTNVNEAPVLAPNSNSVSYTENGSALKLMPTASVTDPDSPSSFVGGSITASLGATAVSGDQLVFAGSSGVSLVGNVIWIGFTVVGTVSGYGTSNMTISLAAGATDGNVETVLKALAYQSTSENPTGADRTVTVTFNDGGNDGSGPALSDTSTVTIHVTPVNDAPVAINDTGSATERGGVANATGGSNATGNVLSNDSDVDDLQTSLVVSGVRVGTAGSTGTVGSTLTGAHGSLVLNANGTYTYVIDETDAQVQALNVNGTITDTFTYTVRDPSGAIDTAQLTITINGANDAPVATDDTGSATEKGGVSNGSGGVTATGNVRTNDSDVDNTTSSLVISAVRTGAEAGTGTAGTVGSSLAGQYGSLKLNSDGSYTYTVTETNSTVQALNVGQSVTETFTYTVRDAGGLTDTAQLVITINGANDAAVITGNVTGSVTEASGVANATPGIPTATGDLNVTDVDNAAIFTVQSNVTTSYGTFSIGADGAWTYNLNNANSTVQGLNNGGTLHDLITVTTADGTSKQIDVTINGANDAAVVSSATVNLTETNSAASISTMGSLTITDVDNPATFVAQNNVNGTYGKFSITSAGAWTYTANNAHDEFQVGQTYTDTFSVSAADGTLTTVVINIAGTNDAPVLTVTNGSSGSIGDGFQSGGYTGSTGSPNLWTTNWTEVGDNNSSSNGDIRISSSGGNSYVRLGDSDGSNSSLQRTVDLSGTSSATLTFDYRRVDLDSSSDQVFVQVSTDGVNFTQIAVIGGGNFDDNGFLSASIDLSAYRSSTTTIRFVASGGLGDSDYVYLDNVNISYSNEPTFTENGSAVAIITNATLSDVDDANMASATVVLTNKQAGDQLWINSTALSNGSTGTVNGVSYLVAESAGAITITFSGAATKAAYELAIEAVKYASTSENPSTTDRSFQITVNDGHDNSNTGTAVVHVIAVNDAPLAVNDTGAATEKGGVANGTGGSNATGNVLSNDTDAETPSASLIVSAVRTGTEAGSGASGTVGSSLLGTYGTLTLNANGSYTYVLNDNNGTVQALNVGGTLTDTFTYTVKDPSNLTDTAQLVITINGTNDVAVISGTITSSVIEAGGVNNAVTGTPTATGMLTDTDVDNTPNTFTAVSVATGTTNGYGTYTMTAGGVWTFTLNNANAAVQALNVGQTLTDTFTAQTVDGTSQAVTVTINGTNDAAVISGTTTGGVIEAGGVSNATAGTPTATGTLTDTDVDNTPNAFQAVSSATGTTNGYGTYTMTAGGVWTYTLNDSNPAVQALNSGNTLTDTFTVKTADGTSQVVTVTINGTNDAAVISGITSGSVIEAGGVDNGIVGTPTATGTLTDTDVDNTPNTFQAVAAGAATTGGYGTYALTAGGVWTYTLNNANPTVQALGAGGVLTDTFTVKTADGTPQVVTVTIHGANDAPVTVNDVYTINEDQILTGVNVLANDSDPEGSTLQRVGNLGGFLGPFASASLTQSGDLTVTPTVNGSGIVILTYQASDGTLSTQGTITVNVRPVADAAVLTASGGNEDNAFAIHIALGDTDGSEKATHIELSGYPAGTTFNQGSLQGGVWVIDNPAGIDLAHLTATTPTNYNGTFNLGVSVTVVDHATLTTGLVTDTATSTGTIAVTVNPVNDAPVLTADDATLTETAGTDAGLLSTTGNILSNDHDVDGDTLSVKTIRAANGVPTDESPIAIAPGGNATSHGIYGDLVMHSDGSYTYTANAAFDALADGVQKTDVFKYVATDGNGGDVAQYLTVHLTGVNDTPVPVDDDQNLTDTAAIDAGTVKTFAGSVLANDHDAENDPLTVITIRPDAQSGPTYLNGATTVAHGVYGDLTINPDGTYTYTPNANYDALGAGVSATDVFKYGASDGNSAHGGFLTFHITGGNDPAVFTGIDTTGLTESNVAQSTGGTLVVNDVDGADTLVPQANAAGSNNYGVFNVNADGTWTYTMNSAHGEFVAGQTYTDKLTVHSADGTAHDLTVNILGTDNNHAPDLVNGTYGGTVTGQVHALPASALVNGSFESGGTGWTVASQAGGAAFSSNFPADGSGNFTANSFGQVTGIQTQLTQVVDTLPGLQYTLSFQVYTVSTTPGGHVFVNWNGTQVLAVATGQAIGGYHTFTATVTGTGHDTLQFAVDDPNNNPATYDSWRFDAVSLTPATHYEATSGTIAFSDADVSDVHSVTVTTPVGSNYIGNFVSTVDEATHQVKWTFYASDSALQALSSNSVDQTYTLKIDDGHGGFDTQNVTVTLAKHIDAAPVITSSAQAGFATEDASVGIVNLVQNPTFELPNIYNPVLTPWTVSGAGVAHIYGSGANGSVDAAYLDQNTTLSQTITTQIGTTYTIDFFMHNYGTPFSVSVNGTPVWTTSNVVPNWTEYSVTFTATSTSTVLSFATTGVNGADIDEVSVQAGTKHIVEGIETNAGTITYTDADLMDTHTVAASGPTFTWSGGSLSQAQITALTNASSLTLNATDSTGTGQGSVAWKHSIADSAIQFLNAGQTLTETYTVTIDDGQGGTTSQQVTITINGTNEPVAPTGQAGTLAITEDVTRVLTLSDFGYSDADGDVAAGVTITSLSISSSRGILLYGSSAVTANQFISAADIAAGMLSFAPKDNNFSGSGTFTFKVKDATGMSDATARTMTLAFDGTDRTDTTASGGSTDTTQVTLNSGYVSYFENGGSGDTLRINASSATTFTNLNFLQSSNNLEVGWSTSSATGYATLLDEYVFTSSSNNNTFESFQFQNGGSYLGYSLSSSAYVVSRAMTTTTAGMVIIAGSEAGDTISTLNSNGNNLLFGNGGSDTITGGFGNDLIVGGLGDDTLSGRNGSDTYVFGLADGNDTINDYWASNSDFDRIVIKTGGAAMSGLFAYDNDPNTFYGDLVIQYNGQQVTIQNHFYMNGFQVELINFDGGSVYGYNLGTSDYAIVNGLTADPSEVNGYRTISLSSGNNFVAGELDTANKITGGSGNDLIFGGDQSDILAGGNGNNLIVGGHGDDTLSAGTGNDVYAFGMTDGTDRITDVSGTDAIFIATHGAAMSMLTATDNNNGTTHGDLVIQYNGQQVTVMNHFDGGSSGANSIESIAFDGGSVYGYDLGTSSYAISNADPSNAGGARTIDLSASSAQNFIAGEDGAANVITGGGAKDLIFGGSQNDTLSGGAGNDLIQGGAGDDILMGGLGNDVLRGGSGADTFKFGAGHIGAANLDSILDFSNAEGDKIDISGLLDGIAGVQADGSNINNYVHLTQNGGNVLVQVDTTGAGNFSGNTHDVATLVGYGTSNADIVNMVFKNTDHSMTV
ncbi:VCBS domain-containing protein [Tardiphaga sp. 709]|uniref:VCBS domain-containing protein n=1 Tax=Tardiphaga sp. 709 TaxID=3076039 RepID=UPI0028EDCD4A|nr:VCBS domain-containing protein [Tardiphaga sp. 709]WNV09235.1 VCBS domain-containing protein [Tardiphaga sp. 709]